MKIGGIERNVLRILNVQRTKHGTAECDVELIARETKFYAHKFVLCSCSDYFSRCLNDWNHSDITRNHRRRTDKMIEHDSDKSNRCETDNSHDEISRDTDESKTAKRSEKHGLFKKDKEQISTDTKSKSESDNGVARICLPGIKPDILRQILDCVYTAQLVLHSENINDILLAGCLLQVIHVVS